ncbi:hypothetical protein [Methylobacterium nodulans]|uniref:hypothetical protein n=1 Tax=Methylobacterium nodulans TaxID=114616 RepID=UPI0005C1D82F|nr:hypothetical protein [Methylobacterium nodulans]
MPNPDQIDFRISKKKEALIFAITAIFFVVSAGIVYVRTMLFEQKSLIVGGVGEFITVSGMAFFGIYMIIMGVELFRMGVVVSVGRRGIFDRRVSTDWISWDKIHNVRVMGIKQRGLIFRLNQNAGSALPVRKIAVNVVRVSGSGAPRELWIEADRLEGGSKALRDAVLHFHGIINDPWER